MIRIVDRALESRATVCAACGASLALGLFFIFVWSPLPWGWKGLDDYYDLARALARGEPFSTMDVMWGYAYFLAPWYRLFGDRPWIPLVVQAVVNASIPFMLYELVRPVLGHRVAVMSAVLAGLFSFNTVYASTQAADSVCTVLVVAAMLVLARGHARGRPVAFAAAGALVGLAYQFRPNLILFPAFIAPLYVLVPPRSPVKVGRMAAMIAVFLATGLPWVIRNYRWSGLFVPASTHGGGQLWSGTLQTGEYQENWIYNPRAAFESPPLDYTSIDTMPVVVTASASSCDPASALHVDLVYWTNRDRTPKRATATTPSNGGVAFELPAPPSPSALYYYFEVTGQAYGEPRSAQIPAGASTAPFMGVVSRDHLRDLDVDGYMLDVFDIARMMRHVAWGEPLPLAAALDLDRDGSVTERDIRRAAALLIHERAAAAAVHEDVHRLQRDEAAVTVQFRDGSSLSVPRQWSGVITDLSLRTVGARSMVALLVSRSRPFARLASGGDPIGDQRSCLAVADVGVNRVPYRRQPHDMRRYTALSLQNVRRDPIAYLAASARRALRVFVITGSADVYTAHQFARAGTIYGIGRVASIAALALFLVGLGIAIVRRLPVFMLLVPIVYVPLTICFMLINARYSMTTQPFAFAFVALALVTAMDALAPRRS